MEELGFRWADTKILLNSQAHFDHAAGTAEIARETGAQVEVMEGDAAVMETGDANDFGGPELTPFAPVHVDRVLHDMDAVGLGGTLLMAHKTGRPHARMHHLDDAGHRTGPGAGRRDRGRLYGFGFATG